MKNILIVDDCQEFGEVVGDFLTEAGYNITIASDGESALQLCAQSVFDVILCDLVLPCGDSEMFDEGSSSAMAGVHLIHVLSKKYPQVPVLAISGQLTGESLQGISQFGAVRCLAKPVTQTQLLQAVQAALESQQQNVEI